jgi:hypothetical protein
MSGNIIFRSTVDIVHVDLLVLLLLIAELHAASYYALLILVGAAGEHDAPSKSRI